MNCNNIILKHTNENSNAYAIKELTTPLKVKKSFIEYSNELNNDSTMIKSSQPTFSKFNSRVNMVTPIPKLRKNEKKFNETNKKTPLKKSKRRECTPIYSDDEEEMNFFNDTFKKVEDPNKINSLNYNILKKGNGENFTQVNLNSSTPTFEKISKSKFLEKINNETNSNVNTNMNMLHSEDIMDKIRGAYLFCKIENDVSSPEFRKLLIVSMIENSELLNKINNLISFCFFEGFNSRDDIFFNFLVFSLIIFRVTQ